MPQNHAKQFIMYARLPCRRLSGAEWASNYLVGFPSEYLEENKAIEDLRSSLHWLADNLSGAFLHRMEYGEIELIKKRLHELEGSGMQATLDDK